MGSVGDVVKIRFPYTVSRPYLNDDSRGIVKFVP